MFADPFLTALVEVARSGSFEGAAARLGVTPSAVSQRIKSLEERIGTVVVERGTPCVPTAVGQRLVSHAQTVGILERDLLSDLRGEHPNAPAVVKIAVNADSLATWFVEALAGVDGYLYDLVLDDQDHSAEWLRKGEVVAAVSGSPGPVQGCDSTALGALRYRATASPDFVARYFPSGVEPAALARAPMLTFNRKDRLQAQWLAEVSARKISPPSHFLASSQAFVEAALAGLGWGMNPEPLVAAHLARGSLVELIPDAVLDTPLYWQISRMAKGSLTDLTQSLRATAHSWLLQDTIQP